MERTSTTQHTNIATSSNLLSVTADNDLVSRVKAQLTKIFTPTAYGNKDYDQAIIDLQKLSSDPQFQRSLPNIKEFLSRTLFDFNSNIRLIPWLWTIDENFVKKICKEEIKACLNGGYSISYDVLSLNDVLAVLEPVCGQTELAAWLKGDPDIGTWMSRVPSLILPYIVKEDRLKTYFSPFLNDNWMDFLSQNVQELLQHVRKHLQEMQELQKKPEKSLDQTFSPIVQALEQLHLFDQWYEIFKKTASQEDSHYILSLKKQPSAQ